mmetsp:Transcript_31859/g.95358  ORF Transcript_31859/g.95358 Transcript_31859/m.95358 type:complete len:88 (+) Transcript_31859:1289-1552(+)
MLLSKALTNTDMLYDHRETLPTVIAGGANDNAQCATAIIQCGSNDAQWHIFPRGGMMRVSLLLITHNPKGLSWNVLVQWEKEYKEVF